jgi:hypothetical protein
MNDAGPGGEYRYSLTPHQWDVTLALAEVMIEYLTRVPDDEEAASLAESLRDWVRRTNRWRGLKDSDEAAGRGAIS